MDISYNEGEDTAPEVKVKEETCDDNFVQNGDNLIDSSIQIVGKGHVDIKRFSLHIKPQNEKMYRLSNTVLSIIFTVLAMASLITYHIVNFECSKELDLNVLQQSLSKNLVGQPQAIDAIIKSLEEKSRSKILLLYGGTGVGKTFTISLILENLYRYANIYHYTMPSFVERLSTDLMVGLTLCPSSVIVVDDLGRHDLNIKGHVLELIKKSENLNKSITIVLVFNCDTINDNYIKKCDHSFYTDLKQTFHEINASKRFIKYNSLTEEHLQRCIEKELGNRTLTEGQFKDIIKNFNVTIDGCKGVYTKMKLLSIL